MSNRSVADTNADSLREYLYQKYGNLKLEVANDLLKALKAIEKPTRAIKELIDDLSTIVVLA